MRSRPASESGTENQPSFARPNHTEKLVRHAFDDIALLIGGVATLHQLEDDLTWTLMKRLDRIRLRLLCDLKGRPIRNEDFQPDIATPPRVHAAVDEFLARNRSAVDEGERL